MKLVPRQLVIVGTIIVVIAGLLTYFACGLGSNSVRRSTALFLEPICPAARMAGWAAIPPWHRLFSGLLWLWALGVGSILAGGALWMFGQWSRRGEGGSRAGDAAMPRMKPVMVGQGDLGRGDPMTGEQLRDFERRFRRSIEQQPLEQTEAMLRQEVDQLGLPLLREVICQPPETIAIEGWDGIAADMADARERLPPEQSNEPWRSVILALVYRNDYADTFILPSFALTAEMDRSVFKRRPGLMSDERHRQWLAANGDLATLPPHPHYRAYSTRERTRLVGLERLRAVESWTALGEDWSRLSPAIGTARALAAGIVLLRFCQAAERHLAQRPLPGNPTAFLTVDMAEWPMETNTIDYCIYAVRRGAGAATNI